MYIEKLKVNQVRNLQTLSLEPSKKFNLIAGLNGSGKTSLLEAIHLLSVGRSFRTPKIKNIISTNAEECTLFSVICADDYVHKVGNPLSLEKGAPIRVGLKKTRASETTLRINGKDQNSFSYLANLSPVQVIAPELNNLIDSSPVIRRQMLDWGVFHVEHLFHDKWKVVQRLIQQRNALLRNDRTNTESIFTWDTQLAVAAEELSILRSIYLNEFIDYIYRILERFESLEKFSITYYKGWKDGRSFYEILQENRNIDCVRGYTTCGPHRADVKVRSKSGLARDVCSRGQKKLLSLAIKLAQVEMLYTKLGKNCVVLIDDLSSELDHNNKSIVCDILSDTSSQIFLTCINSIDLAKFIPENRTKLFQAKEGHVSEFMRTESF